MHVCCVKESTRVVLLRGNKAIAAVKVWTREESFCGSNYICITVLGPRHLPLTRGREAPIQARKGSSCMAGQPTWRQKTVVSSCWTTSTLLKKYLGTIDAEQCIHTRL